jgi:predicted phosphodiesterase
MRILVLSDIHANWPALAAVAAEPHDVCLCLGDLVDYGAEPARCIDWARRHAAHAVRGNHDHGVAQNVPIQAATGFKYLTAVTRPFTRARLAPADLRFLAGLPVTVGVTLAGRRYLLAHATPRDPLDEYAPAEVEFWEKRLERVEADVVLVGHTHQQYTLTAAGRRVINPGSVGVQRDGDPRAGYAVLDGDGIELKRVEYPVEEAVWAVEAAGLPGDVKRLLAEVYRTGKLSNGPPRGAGMTNDPPMTHQ